MPGELVLVAGSFGGCGCPLPCSDLGYAACSLWQGKKKKKGYFCTFSGLSGSCINLQKQEKKIYILAMGMF